jgi:hypothetical protein
MARPLPEHGKVHGSRGWALRVHDLVAPARKAADELAAQFGRPAMIDEIAARLGVDVETLLRAEEAAHARAAVSLDAVMGSGLRRADSIDGADAVDFEAVVSRRLTRDRDHLLLVELHRCDEDVSRPSLAELAVAHVDEQRLALDRNLHSPQAHRAVRVVIPIPWNTGRDLRCTTSFAEWNRRVSEGGACANTPVSPTARYAPFGDAAKRVWQT